MVIIMMLFTYLEPFETHTYADVYLRAAFALEKRGVPVSYLDVEPLFREYVGSEENFMDTAAIENMLSKHKQDVIFHDHTSFFEQIVSLARHYDATALVSHFIHDFEEILHVQCKGRVQSNSPLSDEEALEEKVGFVKRMREEGIIHPKTVLRDELPARRWNYKTLVQMVGNYSREFIIKKEHAHRSFGVYKIRRDDDTINDRRIVLAQRYIRDGMAFPTSLRVITFDGEVVGSFVFLNTQDKYRSNFPDYIVSVWISEQNPEWKGFVSLRGEEYFLQHGVDPQGCLVEKIQVLCERVGSLPSRSLLRGIDICFDEAGNPYVLEAQTGPGNIRKGNFARMMGGLPRSEEYNVACATMFLADTIYSYLAGKRH